MLKRDRVTFTGIDSPYEAPHKPDIWIKTLEMEPYQAADVIIKYLFNNR